MADDQIKKQALQEQLNKLEVYEKVCRGLVEMAACQEASQPSPSRRRHRSKEKDVPPLQLCANGLLSVSARYAYSGHRKIRARRYAVQTSAQKCARRIQTQIFAHTIDLDIENCCATLVLQLIEKLRPQPPMPEEAVQALRQWTSNRASVCREELKVSEREGKSFVTALLSGATPDRARAQTFHLLRASRGRPFISDGLLALRWSTNMKSWKRGATSPIQEPRLFPTCGQQWKTMFCKPGLMSCC